MYNRPKTVIRTFSCQRFNVNSPTDPRSPLGSSLEKKAVCRRGLNHDSRFKLTPMIPFIQSARSREALNPPGKSP